MCRNDLSEDNPKFDKKWADEEMRKIGKKRFREYYCW